MEVSEKEVEDAIMELADNDVCGLRERGLFLHPFSQRQVRLNCYGIADIISYDYDRGENELRFIVCEIKKGAVTLDALAQAARYARAITLWHKAWEIENKPFLQIEICLVGDSIDLESDLVYLIDFIQCNVSMFTYQISLATGITFQQRKDYARTGAREPDYSGVFNLADLLNGATPTYRGEYEELSQDLDEMTNG